MTIIATPSHIEKVVSCIRTLCKRIRINAEAINYYGQILRGTLQYRLVMAELIEHEDVRPLLEVILEELDAIKDKWREVGEVLRVSKSTLDELQKGANVNDKENFKLVMKEWIEKNTSKYLWSPLLQALNNSDLDVSLLDLEGLRETYCPANEPDESELNFTASIDLSQATLV